MIIMFLVLIVLAVFLISFFILIQNPKSGNMDSSIMGGSGNQIFGVQKSTDIIEKGTWTIATIILILCISSTWFIGKNKSVSKEEQLIQEMKVNKSVIKK